MFSEVWNFAAEIKKTSYNEKDKNAFSHACCEHVAADKSVGTNCKGETCR